MKFPRIAISLLLSAVVANSSPTPQEGDDAPPKPWSTDQTFLCDPTLGFPPSDPSDPGACPNTDTSNTMPTFKCVSRGTCPNSDPNSGECRYYGVCALIRRDGTGRLKSCSLDPSKTNVEPRSDVLCRDNPTDDCVGLPSCPGIWAFQDYDEGGSKKG